MNDARPSEKRCRRSYPRSRGHVTWEGRDKGALWSANVRGATVPNKMSLVRVVTADYKAQLIFGEPISRFEGNYEKKWFLIQQLKINADLVSCTVKFANNFYNSV